MNDPRVRPLGSASVSESGVPPPPPSGTDVDSSGRTEAAIRAVSALETAHAEIERLRACMKKAGLAAFMRDGDPEAVAEHLRSVIDSYEKPAAECSRLQAEAAEHIRAKLLAMATAAAAQVECERLQERVRVLRRVVVTHVAEIVRLDIGTDHRGRNSLDRDRVVDIALRIKDAAARAALKGIKDE